MTALDDRPAEPAAVACSWSVEFAFRLLETLEFFAKLREECAYAAGFADGNAAGLAHAEREIAEEWACLARMIRRGAGRLREPVAAPAERPQGDDRIWFTDAEWANWAGTP